MIQLIEFHFLYITYESHFLNYTFCISLMNSTFCISLFELHFLNNIVEFHFLNYNSVISIMAKNKRFGTFCYEQKLFWGCWEHFLGVFWLKSQDGRQHVLPYTTCTSSVEPLCVILSSPFLGLILYPLFLSDNACTASGVII